jgi:hypothetical protein
MKIWIVSLALVLSTGLADARGERYSCTPGKHTMTLDFGAKIVSLDDASAPLVRGDFTWTGKPGGHSVIVVPPEKPSLRIFDVSIDGGRDYSGFTVCKTM